MTTEQEHIGVVSVGPAPSDISIPDFHKAAFEELCRRFDGFGDDVNHGSDRWFQGEKFMAHNIISLFKEIMRDFETPDGASSMTAPQPAHGTSATERVPSEDLLDAARKAILALEYDDLFIAEGRYDRQNAIRGLRSALATPQPVINPTHSQVAGTSGLLTDPAPAPNVETLYRWRGPRGGWIYDERKPTGWHSERLEVRAALAASEGSTDE